MSVRDGNTPESSRENNGNGTGSSQTPRHECDLPIRIVVFEPLPGSNSGVYRVVAGRQCQQAPDGVGFICRVRLPDSEIFLELCSANRELRCEAASIAREAQTPDGRWRYDAVFIEPASRVDRYEFD